MRASCDDLSRLIRCFWRACSCSLADSIESWTSPAWNLCVAARLRAEIMQCDSWTAIGTNVAQKSFLILTLHEKESAATKK